MKLTRWLSFVFFLSGFSALIYQVVWQRILTMHYGVGPISTALIVSVYMAGLGLGALAGGYWAEQVKKKIEIYALIELLIGCFGLLSLSFLDFLGRHTAGSSYVLSFFYMTLFLFIPTFLMGTTLPILTKIFNRCLHDFSQTVSFLYFINTIGAAAGAIVASYGLISFWGLDVAVYAAVGINGLLAVIIFSLARLSREVLKREVKIAEEEEGLGRLAYLFVFFTGFLAIGYEIVWFRVIGVLIKGSPYVFPSVLSVYLLGVALGSFMMGRWLVKHPRIDKRNLFFLYQFFMALSVAFIFLFYYYASKFTPFGQLSLYSFRVPEHPFLLFWGSVSHQVESFWIKLYALLDVFWWPFFFVFIPTCFMGASFPLIARLALVRSDREGHTIGQVYFYNIVGNVLGGIITGFVLLHYLGTEWTVIIFVSMGMLFGLWIRRLGKFPFSKAYRFCVPFILIVLVWQFFPKSGDLYRLIHSFYKPEFLEAYVKEGLDGVVAMHHTDRETTNFINGTTQGGRPSFTFYALTAESLSFVPHAKKVLVIGFGTGGVVEAALKMKSVEKVTVVELSDSLIANLEQIPLFHDILSDPRVELVIDDGRRFLLGSREEYDLIISFLVRSTTAYSNNIYSMEFFELIKQHLSPQGVFLVWAHDTSIIAKTLAYVFPHVNLYTKASGIFCIASKDKLRQGQNVRNFIVSQFPAEDQDNINKSFPTLSANRSRILTLTDHLPVNRDLKPVCEYYIGITVRLMSLENKGL